MAEGLQWARARDQQDALARFRQRFVAGNPDLIYLDGNSLGRLPQATRQHLQRVVDHEWGERLIRSWNEGWMEAATRVGGKIAAIVGAEENEVLLADSTSVNLYKLALAALLAHPERRKIVTDDLNFPSDIYILQAVCQLLGQECRLEIVPSQDGIHGPVESLMKAVDRETALLTLSHTTFKSGYTYDMVSLTRMAHEAGAMALWDLSHSAGALPIDLRAAEADLAVGCTYKHLNGGPGAPAFLYVRHKWQEKLQNPISGWMGREEMFAFDLDYQPAPGLLRFVTGTPPILSLSGVEPGVEMILEAGIERIRVKSLELGAYFRDLWRDRLAPLGFRFNSPSDPTYRGSHISLGHDEGYGIDQALIEEMNVLPDFRAPDNIRFGLVPLYTSFEDVYTAVSRLQKVVRERRYEKYALKRDTVT